MTAKYVLALDQGTTSTRAILFDHSGTPVSSAQLEHRQSFPKAGWVEHDALEIWRNTMAVITQACQLAGITGAGDIAAIGITNQRETTVLWDRATGAPVHPAIVWQDTRTAQLLETLRPKAEVFERTGLPLSTYFSGPKLRWLLDEVPGLRSRAEAGELAFGTIDTWLAWNLTGGKLHVTDVTNASRTMLMDLTTLQWDPELLAALDFPAAVLPEIRSSSEIYGEVAALPGLESVTGVPIAGILGDQHAATFGQACFEPGTAKNTYGTGNFMLMNTGNTPVKSGHGLLTTVCYQLGSQPAVYALEGSIAVSGSLIQWLRDNLGIIASSSEVEELAAQVPDNGGVYFVPAFSGLFAPHWRPDARGAIVGLTRFANRNHIARAALEATAFQTREVLLAMNADSFAPLKELRVDGGMVANETLMQFQADLLGVDVVRPKVAETTALGVAYAAGLAVRFWDSTGEVAANWAESRRWKPAMDPAERDRTWRLWQKAVNRTLDWVDADVR